MNRKMTILLSASLVVSAMLMLPACDWFRSKPTTGEEGKKLSFYLLDANNEEIYKDAHIPGALHVTTESLDSVTKDWDKDATIVVYCSPDCGTKDIIAKKLRDNNFKNVKVYVGGITEWNKLSKENKEAYPIEGEAKHKIFEKETELSGKKESTESEITTEDLKNYLQSSRK